MDVFVVERFLVGWSPDEVDDLVRRLDDLGPQLARLGARHLESIVIPSDETCLSVFEAPDAERVAAANEFCALPTGRVLCAVAHRSRS